jgi:hypothetical protein
MSTAKPQSADKTQLDTHLLADAAVSDAATPPFLFGVLIA